MPPPSPSCYRPVLSDAGRLTDGKRHHLKTEVLSKALPDGPRRQPEAGKSSLCAQPSIVSVGIRGDGLRSSVLQADAQRCHSLTVPPRRTTALRAVGVRASSSPSSLPHGQRCSSAKSAFHSLRVVARSLSSLLARSYSPKHAGAPFASLALTSCGIVLFRAANIGKVNQLDTVWEAHILEVIVFIFISAQTSAAL
ncbi:hypothetical protein LY78DRAFT_300681 [Colletotrichum sublineola]|nr:hypothetical protein LY78DRAFT_300681 [Colletotrichum sublineola]